MRYASPGCALLLVAVLNGGCAVNDIGLVRVRRFENESASVVSLESWGAHLLTAAGDAGLTLFRRGEVQLSVPLAAITGDGAADLHPAVCDPCPGLAGLGTPVFRAGTIAGASLDTNRDRIGVSLGLRQRAVLELPAEGSTVVFLRYRPGIQPRVIIGKEIQR